MNDTLWNGFALNWSEAALALKTEAVEDQHMIRHAHK